MQLMSAQAFGADLAARLMGRPALLVGGGVSESLSGLSMSGLVSVGGCCGSLTSVWDGVSYVLRLN